MRLNRRIQLALVVALIAVVVSGFAVWAQPDTRVQNIIFMIGDGMGFGHVQAGRIFRGEPLFMESAPVKGQLSTDALNGLTTDSAAAATALASGQKTVLYHVGVSEDGRPLPLISEVAKAAGKSVGIVTTARITHATPAGFSAHVPDRDMEKEIATAQLETGFDLFLGGGATEFLPGLWSKKPALIDTAREKGYRVVRTRDELFSAVQLPLLGLFEFSHMNYEAERDPAVEPSLAEMTSRAIELLSQNDNGFFLMVEGARIDHLGHDNRTDILGEEVVAFDDAVRVAVQFADTHPGTLVVVTADHETGGLSVGKDGILTYSSTDHTKAQVPLFAFGTGALAFEKAADIAGIPKIASRLAGLSLLEVGEGKRVKVMTYNIHTGVGIDLVRDLDRIADLIRNYEVDIAGLNEVDKGTRRSGNVDQAKYLADRLGWNYYFGDNWSYDGGRYGNALVTRYPIVSATNYLLPNPRGEETRGLLHAVIDIDGTRLNVFITHLDARHQDVRVPQAKAIADITSRVEGPKILLGDFNAIPMLSPEIAAIFPHFGDSYSTYKMLTDSKTAIQDGFFHRDYLKGGYTYSADDPNRRIDYIFSSFDIAVCSEPGSAFVPKTPASDHLPYVATFKLGHRDVSQTAAEVAMTFLNGSPAEELEGKSAGLVVSQPNRDWYKDFRWDYDGEMEIAQDLLTGLGFRVVILDDPAAQLASLTAAEDLDIVVLPNSRRLSAADLEALRTYVGGGGRLLAFGQSSLEITGAAGSKGDFELAGLFGAHFVGWQGVTPLHGGIKVGDVAYPLGRNQALLVSVEPEAQVVGLWVNNDGSFSHERRYNAAVVRNGRTMYVGEMLFAEENAENPEVKTLLANLFSGLLATQ